MAKQKGKMMMAKNSKGMPNMKAITIRNKSMKNNVATILPVNELVPDSRILPITSV